MIRVRAHNLDGGVLRPEYVGGSVPAMKCEKCRRFISREASHIVERQIVQPGIRDLNPGMWT